MNTARKSRDFMEQAVLYKLEGHTFAETARAFHKSESTIKRWVRIQREKGAVVFNPKPPAPRKVNLDELRALYEQQRDLFQYEAAEKLGVTQPTICRNLKRLGFSQKKRLSLTRSRTKRPSRSSCND